MTASFPRLIVCLGVTAAILLTSGSRQASAQELFYQAYEEGLKAFEAGQLDVAARRLQRALEIDPAQSRQKRYYGMTFRPYIPEFYLGLIAARQKQYQRALEYFQRVEKAGLLRKGDKEFDRLVSERTSAQNAANAAPVVASNTPTPAPRPPAPSPTAPTPPDAGTRDTATGPDRSKVEPPPVARVEEPTRPSPPPPPTVSSRPEIVPTPPPVGTSAADRRAEFNGALQRREYEEAWTAASRMSNTTEAAASYDKTRAALKQHLQEQLGAGNLREADRLLSVATRLLKGDPDVARIGQAIGERRTVLLAERQALSLLLKGQYQQSIDVGAPFAEQKKASRRLLFYMACGQAGISLVSTEDAAVRLKTARELFASSVSGKELVTAHARYISPQILGLLTSAAP